MKIAVIGAGYAGLAIAWHLLQKGVSVTVFDGGEGASHASTGLLHKRPGKKALLTKWADEGMREALVLLQAASGSSPVFLQNGILRIKDGEQTYDPEGITVFSKKYLHCLKEACSGAEFRYERIEAVTQVDTFDRVVWTVGADTEKFFAIPLKRTIGQCLVCRCKEPIGMSLLSQGHITPTEDPEVCLVGSTYEHTETRNIQKAFDLLKQCATFYPPAAEFTILDVRWGIRVAPKTGYIPIVQKVSPNAWVFTGLGSRGLIYHGLFGKSVAEEILS
jgi:glycine/D-amino acid oxidase-like deaminating enzyme